MDDTILFARNQQALLSHAFDKACKELGIGSGSLDVWKQERLSRILEECAASGLETLEMLHAQAVARFREDLASSKAC
jgi:hypothetical protein